MWLSLELLVACRDLSAVSLPLVGAEFIWVGLGETAALRIYLLVVIENMHGNAAAFILGTTVFHKGFWFFFVRVSILYYNL